MVETTLIILLFFKFTFTDGVNTDVSAEFDDVTDGAVILNAYVFVFIRVYYRF